MNALVLAACVPVLDVKPLIRGLSRPLVSAEPDPLSEEDEEEPDELGSVVEGDVVVVPDEGDKIGVGEVGLVELGPGLGLNDVLVPELEPGELGAGLEGDPGCTWTQSFLVTLLTADVRAVWVRSADAAGARTAAGPSDAPACPDVAAATMPKLEADTTRKLPAARPTVGRTCGKRMKALPLPGCCFCETTLRFTVVTSDAYHHV